MYVEGGGGKVGIIGAEQMAIEMWCWALVFIAEQSVTNPTKACGDRSPGLVWRVGNGARRLLCMPPSVRTVPLKAN